MSTASIGAPPLAPGRVLVVDDHAIVARALAAMVEKSGHEPSVCHDVEEAMRRFEGTTFDAVLSDVKMGTLGGFDLLRRVRQRAPNVPVVLITGEATVTDAMEAMEQGAYDYISKPVRPDVLGPLLHRAIHHRRILAHDLAQGDVELPPPSLNDIIGGSPLMLEAFKMVARAAPGDSTVLILGESGTGKERVARALHEKSQRAGRPFVAVNVTAIVSSLAESELFGHVKGAFTDAVETRSGLFREAEGGTLFLDEIGELALPLQAKLLRAIQERSIKPVGGKDEVKVDIRIVAATNVNLLERVRRGLFREDLYYRINVVPIHLPALRERREDVPQLARYFLARYTPKHATRVPRFSNEALAALQAHDWPGNVRELENVVQYAIQLCTDGLITPDLLKLGRDGGSGPPSATDAPMGFVSLRIKMDEYVDQVLEHTGYNLTRAAKILGIARRTLQRMAARRRGVAARRDSVTQRAPN